MRLVGLGRLEVDDDVNSNNKFANKQRERKVSQIPLSRDLHASFLAGARLDAAIHWDLGTQPKNFKAPSSPILLTSSYGGSIINYL